MKTKSQVAILKTIVKWQALEVEALQERVEALEKALPKGLVGGVVPRPPLEFPPEYYEDVV